MLSLSSELYLLWSFLPSLRLVSFCPPLSSRHGFVDTYKHLASCSTPFGLVHQSIHPLHHHRHCSSSRCTTAIIPVFICCRRRIPVVSPRAVVFFWMSFHRRRDPLHRQPNLALKTLRRLHIMAFKALRVLVIIFTMISCLGGKQWLCPHLAICVV